MQHIFKRFLKNFVEHIYPIFVKIPGENLARVMEVYKKLGFPGHGIDGLHPVEVDNVSHGVKTNIDW